MAMDSERGCCPTILLNDLPSDSDSFSKADRVGPHSKLADAIVQMIKGSDSGNLISIEGAWGSGKSTVVSLIAQRLNLPNEHLFAFDAWAHTGDPLRLEFLRALATSLKSADWIDQSTWKAWKKRFSLLSGRTRRSKVDNRAVPSGFGIIFAITVLMAVPGVAMLQSGLDEGFVWSGSEPAWLVIFGSVLSFLPAIVGAVKWALNFDRLEELAIVVGAEVTRTTSTERSSPETTSVEFENSFRWLARQALSVDPSRRLVIVIDNLDRVPIRDVVTIWTALQAFTRLSLRGEDDAIQRHWVIVPFDPKSINRIWESETSSGADDGAGSPKTVERAHLLDKTFHARFQLGLPLPSDWREYLHRSLAEAFPEHDTDEFAVIRQIYNLVMPPERTSPREIRAFVNQIGSIHRQWQNHEFKLAEIAFYVLLERTGKVVNDVLLHKPDFQVRIESLFELDLAEPIAALAFNVERKRGFEVLLADPAYEALSRGDVEGFEKLFDAHPQGFWTALQRILDRIDQAAGDEFGMVLESLLHSKALTGLERESLVLNVALDKKAKRQPEWDPAREGLGRALAALATRFDASEPVLTEAVANSISPRRLSKNEAESEGEFGGLRMAIQYGDALAQAGKGAPVFRHGFTPARWLSNLTLLAEFRSSRTAKLLVNALPTRELINYVTAVLGPGVVVDVSGALNRLNLSDQDTAALSQKIREGLNPDGDLLYLTQALRAYSTLSYEGLLPAGSEQALTLSRALLQLWSSISSKPASVVRPIAFVAALAGGVSQLFDHPNSGLVARFQMQMEEFLASESQELANGLAEEIVKFDQLVSLLQFVVRREKIDPLLLRVLEELVSNGELGARIPLKFYFDAWPFGVKAVAKASEALSFYGDDEVMAIVEAEGIRLPWLDFYAACVSSGSRPRTLGLVQTLLGDISQERWVSVLHDRAFTKRALSLFGAIRSSHPSGDVVPDHMVDALNEVASADVIKEFGAFLSDEQKKVVATHLGL